MGEPDLDPRLHACRADLADASLRGRVEARRFVAGELHEVAEPVVAFFMSKGTAGLVAALVARLPVVSSSMEPSVGPLVTAARPADVHGLDRSARAGPRQSRTPPSRGGRASKVRRLGLAGARLGGGRALPFAFAAVFAGAVAAAGSDAAAGVDWTAAPGRR